MLHIREEVRRKYPTTTFGAMLMRGFTPREPTLDFLQKKTELELSIRRRFSGMDKKEMRSLPPFRDYHEFYKRFKKTYHVLHQCVSIASGSRSLPAGPPLVQAMFMAELKNQLLTAGYDCGRLRQYFQVGLADGQACFAGIGNRECCPPGGDILFCSQEDILGSIICGPDHAHRLQDGTTDVLFAVYGVPGITTELIEEHLEDIRHLVRLLDPGAAVESLEVL